MADELPVSRINVELRRHQKGWSFCLQVNKFFKRFICNRLSTSLNLISYKTANEKSQKFKPHI